MKNLWWFAVSSWMHRIIAWSLWTLKVAMWERGERGPLRVGAMPPLPPGVPPEWSLGWWPMPGIPMPGTSPQGLAASYPVTYLDSGQPSLASKLPEKYWLCILPVWSLTQLPFCWLFTIKDWCRNYFFKKRTNKVCASFFTLFFWPGNTNLTVSLFLCSSGSNTQGDERALEGHRVSSKSPSRVWDGSH